VGSYSLLWSSKNHKKSLESLDTLRTRLATVNDPTLTTRSQTSVQAFAFVQQLATELSAKGSLELPAFPDAAMRVHRALADPNSPVERIAQIVSGEPALAARLMSMANSAAFAASGKPIADLRSAILRLGGNAVRSAAVAFAVAQLKSAPEVKSIAPQLESLWNESARIAALCHVLAQRTRINPDEAFLAGLLHGIGKLYILARAARHPELFNDAGALTEVLQTWHANIAKAILESWNIPAPIAEAVGDQNDMERKHYGDADLTDVLVCAKFMIRTGENPAAQQELKCRDCFRQLRLEPADCAGLLQQTAERVGALRAVLG